MDFFFLARKKIAKATVIRPDPASGPFPTIAVYLHRRHVNNRNAIIPWPLQDAPSLVNDGRETTAAKKKKRFLQ